LSLSLIRNLRHDLSLLPKARKLLSFTDNRQDASLQAGHFNDFVEIALLRSAIYKAVEQAGANGIAHDVLTQKVFSALGLDFKLYAIDPMFASLRKRKQSERCAKCLDIASIEIRSGLAYNFSKPEQCGLLQIQYTALDEVCTAEDVAGCSPGISHCFLKHATCQPSSFGSHAA
jgi:hypothetical protein